MISIDLDELYKKNFCIDYELLTKLDFLKKDIYKIANNYKKLTCEEKFNKHLNIDFLDEALSFFQNLDSSIGDIPLAIYNDENTYYKSSRVLKDTVPYIDKNGEIKVKKVTSPNILGTTFYNRKTHNYEINIKKGKTVDVYDTITHEFGHLIGQYLRKKYKVSKDSFLFDEVESIFMSILSLDYAEKNDTLKKEMYKQKINKYYNWFVENTSTLAYKFLIMDKYNLKFKITNPKNLTYDSIKRNILDNHQQIYFPDELFESNIKYFINYYIGTFISFELYYIYQKEPLKALDLYKKIILTNGKDEKEIFEKIINFGVKPEYNSFDNYARTIKKH